MQNNRPMDSKDLTPAERELEAALSALPPARPRLDLQQIQMIAVTRRDQRRLWFWRGVSGALAACLAATIWIRHPAVSVDRSEPSPAVPLTMVISRPQPQESASTPDAQFELVISRGDQSYLQMRQRILLEGLDAFRPMAGVSNSALRDPIGPLESERAIHPQASPPRDFTHPLKTGTSL